MVARSFAMGETYYPFTAGPRNAACYAHWSGYTGGCQRYLASVLRYNTSRNNRGPQEYGTLGVGPEGFPGRRTTETNDSAVISMVLFVENLSPGMEPERLCIWEPWAPPGS